MVGDKTGKGLADDQADVEGQTGIGPRSTAGTVEGDDVVRVLQHDVAGQAVRNGLLQVGQADVLIHSDQLLCPLQRHNFAMVGVSKRGTVGILWPGW